MDQEIRRAIAARLLIEFLYHGHLRIAEPHVYGMKDGKYQLLTYQVAGGSQSGGIPNWRRVDLDEISGLRVLDQTFPGQRPAPSGQHSEWDYVIAIVD